MTCVGDKRCTSFLPSRRGDTLADRCARYVLRHHARNLLTYSFLDRGSDERQYCSPGVDLPVVSIMRSKYGTYPEYHTSRDDLGFISGAGLAGSFDLYVKCFGLLEANRTYRATMPCEPQLSRRGLYPTLGSNLGARAVKPMMHLLAYCDGEHDLLRIAELVSVPAGELARLADVLLEHGIIEPTDLD